MPILTSYPYVGVSSMLHAVWSVPCSPWLPGTHAGRRLFMHTDATTTTTATAWPALPTHMAWAHPARPPPCCPLAASCSCPARAGYKTACQRAKVTSTDELLTTGWVHLTSATDISTVGSPAQAACTCLPAGPLPAGLLACRAACPTPRLRRCSLPCAALTQCELPLAACRSSKRMAHWPSRFGPRGECMPAGGTCRPLPGRACSHRRCWRCVVLAAA